MLDFALRELPTTKIGLSVLSEEPYDRIADSVSGFHFVELNTKCSARLADPTRSHAEYQKEAHTNLLAAVRNFSDAFDEVPQLVKLTRELPWLTACAEWTAFLELLLHLKAEGRQIGIILANTRRSRVAPSRVEPKRGQELPGELSGGVIAGGVLFLETYDLLRELRLPDARIDQFPVVATGGILGLDELVDAVYARAVGVQMCSAFQSRKPHYAGWLLVQLRRLLAELKVDSFGAFRRFVQLAGEMELARIRGVVRRLSVDFDDFIRDEVARTRPSLEKRLVDALREEIRLSQEMWKSGVEIQRLDATAFCGPTGPIGQRRARRLVRS